MWGTLVNVLEEFDLGKINLLDIRTIMTQCLALVISPRGLLHILSCYNHKLKCILLGFYVMDQHKIVHFEEKSEKCLFIPFTVKPLRKI